MTYSISIRNATPQDTSIIFDLIKQLADFEKLSHEVKATVKNLEDTLFGREFSPKIIIAEANQKSVGFALFFFNYSTFLARPGIYLEDLFVIPSMRNQGIGLKLLSNIAKIAVENNCGRIEWSVLKWNVHAKRFYERLKATSQTEWEVYRLTGENIIHLSHT